MPELDRLTITLPAQMAADIKGAVEGGAYASASERALRLQELALLKADIDKGLADVAAGRVQAFDAGRILERGKKLFAARSRSADRGGGK